MRLMFFNIDTYLLGMEKELVYLFLYNPMVCQSGWSTLSVHKHRKDAVKAMEEHKATEFEKWAETFQSETERQEHPFGKWQDWRVNAFVLQ